MEAYVAFLPIAEKITAPQAYRIAGVLLAACPDCGLARSALALALLHASWTHGRLKLAKHLQLLDLAVAALDGCEPYYTGDTYLQAVSDLEEANLAYVAQQYARTWAADLVDAVEGPDYHWDVAQRGFHAALELAPKHLESKQLLEQLLAAMGFNEDEDGPMPLRQATARASRMSSLLDKLAGVPDVRPVGTLWDGSLESSGTTRSRGARVHVMDMRDAPDQMGIVADLLAQSLPGMAGYGRRRLGDDTATPDRLARARATAQAPQEQAAPYSVPVYDPKEVAETLERTPRGGPLEDNRRQLTLMQTMANGSGLRPVAQQPEGDALESLYARFPHFTKVLDFVSRALALAACGDAGRPVSIPPLLLRGEPGTGKTYFAQELARVLALPFIERDLSVTSEAFVINGMDSTWKNSKPGIVFDAVVQGKVANPLILLNEVDKAAVTGTNNSPLAPMYALLEPTSADRFLDEFLPVPIDASRVVWVLTANDGHIPAPILSRLEVFDIATPTRDECRVIAASVWTGMQERTLPKGHGFTAPLSDEVVSRVSRISPRVMRKVLTDAAGMAAQDKRKAVTCTDLDIASARHNQSKGGMGFLPQTT